MVNLHFSLLPRWRGAAPVERAILAGDERTGVDLMVVEEGLDTGGVYDRAEVDDRPRRDGRRAAGPPRRRSGPTCWSTTWREGLGDAGAAGGRADLRPQDRAATSWPLDWAGPAVGHPPAGAGRRRVDHARRRPAEGVAHGPGAGSAARRPDPSPHRRPVPVGVDVRPATASSGSSRCSPRASGACPPPTGPAGCPATRSPGSDGDRPSTGDGRRVRRRGGGSERSGRAAPSAVGPPGGARRARPHRRRRGLRQPRAVGGARPVGPRRRRPPVRHRPRLRHDPPAAGLRLPGRSLPRPPGRRHGSATPCASVPTSSPSPASLRTRRWARRSGSRPGRPAAWSTPCCGAWPTRPVSWPDDATRLSVPDWILAELTAVARARRGPWPPSRR